MEDREKMDHTGLNQLSGSKTSEPRRSKLLRLGSVVMVLVLTVTPFSVIIFPHFFDTYCYCFCATNSQGFVNYLVHLFK